ncbi:MAG: hypothetical protein ABJH04_16200 [Cyclobacteriaceae bacterium]
MSKRTYVGVFIILFSLVGFVEDEPIKELTEKLNAYNEIFPQNKLVLTFNQPEYAPGDTVFFKAHLLDEDLRFIKGRQIASLVLVDAEGLEIIRESFAINDGIGENQTILSSDLSGGVYKLIAYTHWMKNFSSKMFFTSLVTVADANYFAPQTDLPVKMELFAEGGNIIPGVPLRMVTSASKGANPIEAEGRIVDSEGNEIISFACDKTGLANFELTLAEEKQYTLEIKGGKKMPITVEKDGFVLKVAKEGDLLKASIWGQTKKSGKESVYIIATSRSKIRYASMITLSEDGPSSVLIPYKNIPEGITQILLFDAKLNELAKRLVYIDNEAEPTVNIKLNKDRVSTRSAVSFEVNVTDQNGVTQNSDFTISGIYSDLFSEAQQINFREQLLVGSDIPESDYFLNKVDLSTDQGLELLDAFLITKDWERFHWDDVLKNKKKQPDYLPRDILILDGVASLKDNNKPVPDSTQVMFFLQHNIFGYEINTGNNGKFSWPIYFDFFGDENVMYSMESRGKTLNNTSIRLLRDSFPDIKAPIVVRSNEMDPYHRFRTIAQVSNTSFAYEWNKEVKEVENVNPNAAIEDELNGVDFTIKVDDYVVFPTIEDLFREVVRFVQNRKVGGKQTLRVLSSDSNNPMTGDPLYVVDGIATKNTDFILNMNPGDIAIIKVINDVKKLRNLGNITKNGVVFFQTKVANMGSLIPKDDILNIRGLNKPFMFKATPTDYSDRTPYLKSTVYWNTRPEFNERGLISDTFYSADNTGIIKVRVQGITSDGIPFDKEEEVEVSFKPN